MLWLTLNLKPYDGRYELRPEFTTRELGWIKRHAGYLPLALEEGLQGGDAELFGVLAAIAVRRSGRITDAELPALVDRIFDAPFGTIIELEDDGTDTETDGDDASPPAASSSGNNGSSGAGSTVSSETSPGRPQRSGTPGSAISGLAPTRSGT